MRALLQRVTAGSVAVGGQVVASIGPGWVVLVGIGPGDTPAVARKLAEKVATLRCFEDAEGKMNRSALDISAEILVVSQFTLYADTSRGRRPSFVQAAVPELADPLVRQFANDLRQLGLRVEAGQFGADMLVRIDNDGPVTIWLDSAKRRSD